MAKKTVSLKVAPTHLKKRKKTSIGGNTRKTSSMNKSKRRQSGMSHV